MTDQEFIELMQKATDQAKNYVDTELVSMPNFDSRSYQDMIDMIAMDNLEVLIQQAYAKKSDEVNQLNLQENAD
ncbi:MAG: hypothetical protein NW226_17665 [Microscillaceae bacterium]|nr:hypothetical protein [Microscillaceae bacterium]